MALFSEFRDVDLQYFILTLSVKGTNPHCKRGDQPWRRWARVRLRPRLVRGQAFWRGLNARHIELFSFFHLLSPHTSTKRWQPAIQFPSAPWSRAADLLVCLNESLHSEASPCQWSFNRHFFIIYPLLSFLLVNCNQMVNSAKATFYPP